MNAHNGNILSASPTLFEDNDEILLGYKGSDTAQENGFPIEKLEEYYIMSDPSRGLTVYTFNYRSSGNGSGIDHSQAFLVESTDNVFGNTEEETTLEYEKGATLLQNAIFVHDYFDDLDFVPILDTVRLYYNDAYDNGENARGGVANGAGVVSVGWDTGVECVDTIAHEYTHFVSRNIVNWNGNDETGAMNEAMSDLFGELIEAAIKSSEAKESIDPDWVHGRRNMRNPSQNRYPAKVTDTNKSGEDFSHGYSTVITHAAYLMWNGMDGTNSKKVNPTDLAKLWYRAMLMMPADCDFNDCRQLVELAATSMELTTEQIACVSEAFDAVGITGTSEESFDALYNLALDSTLSVYGGDGELYDNYTLKITGNTIIYGPVLEKVDSSYNRTRIVTTSEPYELDLPQGVYVFTISDNANPSATNRFTVCVWNDDGSANLDVFTNFGCTPVKGTVSEIKEVNGAETNIPINNAVVSVYSHAEETVIEKINMAETDGFFEVYLPVGNYSVAVEAEGYISSTTSFQVATDDVYLPIILNPEITKQLTQINQYNQYGKLECETLFQYDEKGILTSVVEREISPAGNILHEATIPFVFDKDGRLIEIQDAVSDYYNYPTADYTYNENGQLVYRIKSK